MASYAPLFVVDIDNTVNAGQTATVSGLNQAFELVNANIDGQSGSVATIKNGGATAAVAYVAGQTVGAMDSTTRLFNSNSTFSASAVITVEVIGANVTRIQLICRAIDSVARSVTVSVA